VNVKKIEPPKNIIFSLHMNFPTGDDADVAWRKKKEDEAMARLALLIHAAMERGYDPDTPLALPTDQDWSALRKYTLNAKGWTLDTEKKTIQGKPKQ
jgi:hypothetical protein